MFRQSVLVLTLVVVLYANELAVANANAENALIDAPFSITVRTLQEALGVEARLAMNDKLQQVGVKDIYLGVQFPACQRVFQIYVIYGEKRVTKSFDIKSPRVCLVDFGIPIPLTSVCFKVANMVLMPRGAQGDLVGDITIGQSILQWRNSNIPITKFHIGQDTTCYGYKDVNSCIKDTNCGWCDEEGGSCLQARKDKKTDVCKFCPRCSFTTSPNTTFDRMRECLRKESCGYCLVDGKCYAGDSLGPFDMTSTVCDTKDSSARSLGDVDSNSWKYEGRGAEQGVGSVGAGFIGATFGLVTGVLVAAIVAFIIFKKARGSYASLS